MTIPSTPGPPGRVIVLNGASSSGKSTLARLLQRRLDTPFLVLSGDQLISAGLLPERRDPSGPFAWVEQLRPRFFDGLHRCIPALAAAGNDVIVEHVVEFATWRAQLDDLLTGFDVFWVAVHCDLAEIDRREAARGDRRPGEGRAHVEVNRIHEHGTHDLHVDTTGGVTDALARTVVHAWSARPGRRVAVADCGSVRTESMFDAAGGAPAFRALADAHHARCLADPVLEHPFSHGGKPDHLERLAAYWAEVFGGPATYSTEYGGHSPMLELHAGMGAEAGLGDRFAACFAGAVGDVLPDDAELRAGMRAYMAWAVAEVLTYDTPGSEVAPCLGMPRWSWAGLRT